RNFQETFNVRGGTHLLISAVLQKRWCYSKLCFYSRTLKEFPSCRARVRSNGATSKPRSFSCASVGTSLLIELPLKVTHNRQLTAVSMRGGPLIDTSVVQLGPFGASRGQPM